MLTWQGILSPCLFNLYAEYTMWNARLDESLSWNQDCWEKCQQPRVCRWYHYNGRKWGEHLDEGETGEWKSWLKTQHSETKILESSPITSWQIDGETVETVTDFIFLGSKITEDGDCSHKIWRPLLLEEKAMANLDSILKSKDITLLAKVCIVKLWFFQQSHMDVRVGP